MPAPSTAEPKPSLERALDAAGEKEYRHLLRALRMARGDFFLFPIESDFPNVLRDALLERLRADLAAEGVCLRVAHMSRQQWDVFALPAMERAVGEADVVALVGLEDTPGIVPEIGAKPVRPPALALLNQQREALHRRVPAPFLVWCPPYVFTTLMEQAPDFFDHFASLFRFHNAAPEPTPAPSLPAAVNPGVQTLPDILSVAAARSAKDFYEEQVTQHPEPTAERARALLGLADTLGRLHDSDYPRHVQRALQLTDEALALLSPERDDYEWARGQSIRGILYNDLPTGDRGRNLQQAIACYEAALQVRTRQEFPDRWATTQNNLGGAYQNLPTGDRGRNLEQAIACYEAALTIQTEADYPYYWAKTQWNLALALEELGRADEAQQALRCAASGFRAAGVETEAEEAERLLMDQNVF